MKKSKFSEDQVACALWEVESGLTPADLCRQLGMSEAMFYRLTNKYAGPTWAQARRRSVHL